MTTVDYLNARYSTGEGLLTTLLTVTVSSLDLSMVEVELLEPVLADCTRQGLTFCRFLYIGPAYPTSHTLERVIQYSAELR